MKFTESILKLLWILPFVLSDKVLDLEPAESDTLVLLHVLFRHGNRTPDREVLFPTDPHRNETYEPFGFSQLTKKGKKTEYEIGKYLRETYGGFIPDQYTPDVAYALSTNFKRTKMSLELVLAGLFPPLESDIFYEGLNWQPVSFNVEQEEDLLRIPLIDCPNFVRQYYKFMMSTEGQEKLSTYKNLYQQLSNYTGLDVTSPDEVLDIYETLTSEQDFGLALPDWTSDFYPEILEEAAGLYFQFATVTTELTRLTNGRLLKKIVDDSLAKRDGTLSDERKIFLYSAHDFHVATLLDTVSAFGPQVPPFGATVFIEIHNIEGIYGLKIFYQDYSETSPRLLSIPGCSSFCELDKFAELMAIFFPGVADVCTYTGELK